MRIWRSPSACGLVKSRRLVTRSSIFPHQASGWCTCIRGWKNWAASIGQTSLSMLDRIGLPTLLNRSKHHLRCPGQNGAGSCVTTIWHGRNHDPNPAPSSLVRSYAPCVQNCRKIQLSPMVPATTPRGCTDTIATVRLAANSHPPQALWATGSDCRQVAAAPAHCNRIFRRWLFPDDRPRVGHGGSI